MNLMGFEKNDEDKGVNRFLQDTGFVPEGACALVCHPDFVHHHRGMEQEYVLYPDNCSYNGVPRNIIRERQEWTNYDVRRLATELEEKGSSLYFSIFGVDTMNACHEEWIYDHPELMIHFLGDNKVIKGHHFVLKRFRDGTYYEDFFIEKTCQVLEDYGAKGIHFADGLCPPGASSYIADFDFSTDFVEQFLMHTGITPPDSVAKTLGDDEYDAELTRAQWIRANHRAAWAEFHTWRWAQFFKKLCHRVHAIGKEVMVLGMYCTDPFETVYCCGIDLRKIVEAGVDYITANILPASGFVCGPDDRPDPFHRYMAIAPLTAAHLPRGHLVSMLGLHDATEEWSAIHHAPTLHERDMMTMMSYRMVDKDGMHRALDGFFLCLGDGIPRNDWDWERERMEIAFSADADGVVSPAILWSDAAFDKMLDAYLDTRRWTPHKLFCELAKRGVHCAASVRTDGLDKYTGTLIVPNFDLLTREEQQAVVAYDRGAVICTACPDFTPEGITPEIVLHDRFSTYPMTVFAFGCTVENALREELEALLAVDDGTENLPADKTRIQEPTRGTLTETLTFAKVTDGFCKALTRLVQAAAKAPLTADREHLILHLKNGAYRLYLLNDSHDKYHRAQVTAHIPIRDVKIVSKFPVLPPRFVEDFTSGAADNHIFSKEIAQVKQNFIIKIPPAGVVVVDVYTK